VLRLRFLKVWVGLGWTLLGLVCLGSLLPASALRMLDNNDKLAHFGSYFVLMVWFAGLYGKPRHYLAIAAILISLGAGLDLLQGLTATRHFEGLDVLANSAGVCVGLIAALVVLGGWCRTVERWFED
jgi:VanZ family protein